MAVTTTTTVMRQTLYSLGLRLPKTACFRGEKMVLQLWDLTCGPLLCNSGNTCDDFFPESPRLFPHRGQTSEASPPHTGPSRFV